MAAGRKLIRAAHVVDGRGSAWGPGAILLDGSSVTAVGTPESVGRPDDAQVLDLDHTVVLPCLVNAHCHLDLTHLGLVPYGGEFTAWIDGVRRGRVEGAAAAASVRRGIELSRAGGTAVVGDISAGASLEGYDELARAAMVGVSFLEVIGTHGGEARALDTLAGIARAVGSVNGPTRLGVSPHAPYTCSGAVYAAAAALDLPLATHLAETRQELELIAHGCGPLADFLEGLGFYERSLQPRGTHPVDLLADVLSRTPCLVAHANYVEPRHIDLLATWRTTVVYCPRASAYFGHRGHRYLDMMVAGVNVALGTDGLMCLDTPDRISVLDEMRFLHRRDGIDPQVLLRMATTSGAAGLGVDPGLVAIAPGPVAGLLAVPFDTGATMNPLRQILLSDGPPEWVAGPFLP